jgi:hypothetical protein
VPVYLLGTIPIVSIERFKAYVNLKFFKSARLQDRAGILEGTGKGVRHVKFRSTEDVDEAKIRGDASATRWSYRGYMIPKTPSRLDYASVPC